MKYTIIKEISSGSFGIVYEVLVEHEEDGMTISTSEMCTEGTYKD